MERHKPTAQDSTASTSPDVYKRQSDTLPTLKGLNFEGTEDMILERSSNNDTLTYWITDTLVSNKDTLTFSLTYLDTDTLGQLTYRTDTLDLIPKAVSYTHLDVYKRQGIG